MSGFPFPLTPVEENFLMGCASAAIRRGVRQPLPDEFSFLADGEEPDPRDLDNIALAAREKAPRLLTQAGAFVTLHVKAHGACVLRGCIGIMEPAMPLILTTARMAWAAAFEDRRFQPLCASELASLELDISVLGELSPCFPQDIELGRHGVRLEAMGRTAVFLPQVPTEQGWDLEQTLEALGRKAGLPPGAVNPEAFRKGISRLFRYEAVLIGPRAV